MNTLTTLFMLGRVALVFMVISIRVLDCFPAYGCTCSLLTDSSNPTNHWEPTNIPCPVPGTVTSREPQGQDRVRETITTTEDSIVLSMVSFVVVFSEQSRALDLLLSKYGKYVLIPM